MWAVICHPFFFFFLVASTLIIKCRWLPNRRLKFGDSCLCTAIKSLSLVAGYEFSELSMYAFYYHRSDATMSLLGVTSACDGVKVIFCVNLLENCFENCAEVE